MCLGFDALLPVAHKKILFTATSTICTNVLVAAALLVLISQKIFPSLGHNNTCWAIERLWLTWWWNWSASPATFTLLSQKLSLKIEVDIVRAARVPESPTPEITNGATDDHPEEETWHRRRYKNRWRVTVIWGRMRSTCVLKDNEIYMLGSLFLKNCLYVVSLLSVACAGNWSRYRGRWNSLS